MPSRSVVLSLPDLGNGLGNVEKRVAGAFYDFAHVEIMSENRFTQTVILAHLAVDG